MNLNWLEKVVSCPSNPKVLGDIIMEKKFLEKCC
jgi:hypothetical protein